MCCRNKVYCSVYMYKTVYSLKNHGFNGGQRLTVEYTYTYFNNDFVQRCGTRQLKEKKPYFGV